MKKKLLIISLFLIVTFLSFFCIKIVENDSMFPVIKNNDVIIVLPLFSIKKNLIYGFKYNNNIYIIYYIIYNIIYYVYIYVHM